MRESPDIIQALDIGMGIKERDQRHSAGALRHLGLGEFEEI